MTVYKQSTVKCNLNTVYTYIGCFELPIDLQWQPPSIGKFVEYTYDVTAPIPVKQQYVINSTYSNITYKQMQCSYTLSDKDSVNTSFEFRYNINELSLVFN